MKIYIGADHRGYELKEQIKTWLVSNTHQVLDCGNAVYDHDDDFPDFGFKVGESVVTDPGSMGIVICGSAGGVTIAANKVKGCRCVSAFNEDEVKHDRQHDDVNVLAVASSYTTFDMARKLIKIFLTEKFLNAERFQRRLKKISDYENR